MEQELIEYIVKNLVNDPTQVRVERRQAGHSIILELSVAREDMGRVIGRNGRVANAMRSLLRAVSSKKDKRIILEID
jgi:predicted RNA-binding protein YlqC (UPF0109 family)